MKTLLCDSCKDEKKIARTYQVNREMLKEYSGFFDHTAYVCTCSGPPTVHTVELCQECWMEAVNSYSKLVQSLFLISEPLALCPYGPEGGPQMTEHVKQYHFFLDAKPYETTHRSLTGADIKKQADVPPTYQLFLEEEGDTPDKPISDGDAVDLEGKEKHFFAVPPVTFGNR